MIGFDVLPNIVSSFIGSALGSIITLNIFKKQNKWKVEYEAFNNALVLLEKLKYISFHHRIMNEHETDLPILTDQKSFEFLNQLTSQALEALIPLKILFKKKLAYLIESYEKKITTHFDVTYWDGRNHGFLPNDDNEEINEWNNYANYMSSQYLHNQHAERIYKSTRAMLKLLYKKDPINK